MKDVTIPVLILVALLSVWFMIQNLTRQRQQVDPAVAAKAAERALLEKAEAEDRQGNSGKVLEILVPAAQSQNPKIRVLLGKAYLARKQFKAAVQVLEGTGADRNEEVLRLLAPAHEGAGELPKAKTEYELLAKSEALKGKRAEFLWGLVRCAKGLHEPVNDEVFLTLGQEDPANEQAFLEAFQALARVKPSPVIEKLVALGDKQHRASPAYNRILGDLFRKAGLEAKAKERYQLCLEKKNEDPEIPLFLFAQARREKDETAAWRWLELAFAADKPLASSPLTPRELFEAGKRVTRTGNFRQGFVFLRKAFLGDRSLLGEGDEGTFAKVRESLESTGTEEEKRFVGAFALYLNGEVLPAKKAMESLLPTVRQPPLLADAKAVIDACNRVIMSDSEYEAEVARQKAAEAAKKAAKPATLSAALAAVTPVSMATGSGEIETPPAILNDQNAIRLKLMAASKPNDPAVQFEVGENLLLNGDVRGGRACFEKALAANPYYWAAHLAIARLDLGDKQKARSWERIQQVAQGNPTNAAALGLMARYYAEEENVLKTMETVKKALALDPNNPEAHLAKAILNRKVKKKAEALDEIEKGLLGETDSFSPVKRDLLDLKARLQAEK